MVDKEQAAVQAQAFPFLLEKGGMVGVFTVGNKGVWLEQLDSLMDEEVDRLIRDGVTDEELQKARNAKETQLAGSYGSMASRARGLARYHVFYGDANLVNTEINNYLKVTKEDVQRVAKKYLTPEAATSSTIRSRGSEARVRPSGDGEMSEQRIRAF